MLRPNRPIYDHRTEQFYFLPETREQKGFDAKLEILESTYNFMIEEYRRIIEKGLLATSIASFRNRFKL